MFQLENRPVIIPPRFRPLFDAIVFRDHDRVNVIAPTQDGKSVCIAIAVLMVVSSQPEKFTILAPSEKKADIIMSYIRNFAVENKVIAQQLELDPKDTLDRLKRERSKKHLTFKSGGGVQTLSLDARNSKRSIEAAMGFGSKNIIGDEIGLIDDKLWATVLRMLGGDFKEEKRKKILIKVGNPFYDNHFKRSSESPRYLQVFHNFKDSIRDYEAGYYGYSPNFIEEARNEPLFDILYECKFPKDDEIDERGYRQLILSDQIKINTLPFTDEIQKVTHIPIGRPKLGGDIGGGGDYNVFVARWLNYARVMAYHKSDDTMVNVGQVEDLMKEFGILPEDVNLDDIGIGRGVCDRLIEKGYAINKVSAGSKASNPQRYSNLKAELSWKARQWVKGGGVFEPCVVGSTNVWDQLKWIKYKVNTDRNIKIEPKEDLKKRTGKSPDFYEAFMLTFYQPKPFGFL
jgi:hypothetical protein